MYQPKHWHWVFPTSIVAFGFGVHQYFYGDPITIRNLFMHLDSTLVMGFCDAIAYHYSKYLWQAGVTWQNFEAEWNAPGDRKPKPQQPVSVPYNDNGRHGLVQLTQITEAPKLSNEQKFYRTLITMRNGGLEVDLKESYWISPVNRYGESRDSFVSMRQRGIDCGALYRVGQRTNAPYAVADWRKVRLLAGGYSPIKQPPP